MYLLLLPTKYTKKLYATTTHRSHIFSLTILKMMSLRATILSFSRKINLSFSKVKIVIPENEQHFTGMNLLQELNTYNKYDYLFSYLIETNFHI